MAIKKSSIKLWLIILTILLVLYFTIYLKTQWYLEDLNDNPHNTAQTTHERTCAAIKTQNYANCYERERIILFPIMPFTPNLSPSLDTDRCIEEIAVIKEETELCKERGLVDCVWRVAMKKNDPKICEEFIEIGENRVYKDDEYFIGMRDSCIYKLANDESPYANQRYC